MDIIVGSNGNDLLTGSEENDQILGGDGNDTLNGLGGEDTLIGEKGNDSLRGGDDNDRLFGDDGNDTLIGDKGSDFFDGGAGNDRLIWNDGDGSDTMRGGAGNDTTVFNGSVASGDDTVLKADGERAIFQRLNLVPITLDVNDVEKFEVNGLGGNDTLTVKDLAATDVKDVIFNGNDGNDRLYAGETNVKITADGGAGNDSLKGGKGHDFIEGGNGNDTLEGGAGNDTLIGDENSDLFKGGDGNDRMIWDDGDGSDVMEGGHGYDTTVFEGSVASGDDTVLKADGARANFQRLNLVPITLDVNDTERFEVEGLGGNDTLTVKDLSATDVKDVIFDGGDGNDRLYAGETNVKITADGGAGNDSLKGGKGHDLIRGGNDNDTLEGGAGNDTLIGDKGSDWFKGGDGNDIMVWNDGDGSDVMEGGNGYDTAVFNGSVASGDDTVLKADGTRANFQRINLVPITLDVNDTEKFEVNGLGGNDTLTVKDLSATDVKDVIFNGNDGNDRLDASQTAVKIIADGGKGDDTLIGGTGSDSLVGGEGSDLLIGGGGNDTIIGGSASTSTSGFIDTFTGNNGNDLYVLANANSVFYNDGNSNTAGLNDYGLIEDFNKSQDKLQLEGSATKYVLGSSPVNGVTGTAIYLDTNNSGTLGPSDELISVVKGVTDFSLTANYVNYV